jgi:hypothetical protein
VWTRAAIGPAWRRAQGVWVGCAIAGGMVFGGNGMHPRDLVGLALHVPAFGAVLAATWLLVFAPIARAIVRPDGAGYLRALPHSRAAVAAIAAVALVGLQLPWLVLWIVGAGARGLLGVGAFTAVVATIAALPVRKPRVATSRWRTATRALVGVYARALVRRGGHAIVRGAGLAVLAGLVGGIFARNNRLAGADAAVMATAVMTVILVAARAGGLIVLLDAHRAAAWLAATTGVSARARLSALAIIVVVVDVAYATLAIGAAAIAYDGDAATLVWLVAIALAVACAVGCATVRVLARAEVSQQRATRVATGAIVVAAGAVAWLATVGAIGAVGALATAAAATLGTRVDGP